LRGLQIWRKFFGVLLQFLTHQDYARFGVYFVQRKIVGGVAFFCGI